MTDRALNAATSTAGATTLIVDDDQYVREELRALLEDDGLFVLEAGDGKTALDVVARGGVDLILLDLELPRISGLDVLRRIEHDGLHIPVVVISGRGSIRSAITATKLGAYEFLEKPVDGERTLQVVRELLSKAAARRAAAHQASLQDRCGIVGSGAVIRQVVHQIARAARADSKVLLIGESGTGKELAARAIHANSARRGGPFVAVNCAAIPEHLIESELFGSERGAFTGALARRYGKIEQAHRGTLFLDEVADMTLMTQAKVLRVLEDRVVQRVGGEREVGVDFRLIAATNQDLRVCVEQGDFREDLYFRLNIVRIDIPTLRARRQDIPELTETFLRMIAQAEQLPRRTLTPAATAALMSHDWPGNVRELRNVAERLLVLGNEGPIELAEVRQVLGIAAGGETAGRASSLREARVEFERGYIRRVLDSHGGRIQDAADELGLNRSHLWRKMKDMGLGDR